MFGTLHLGLRLVTYSPHGNEQRSAAVVLKNNHKTMTVNSTNELSFKYNTRMWAIQISGYRLAAMCLHISHFSFKMLLNKDNLVADHYKYHPYSIYVIFYNGNHMQQMQFLLPNSITALLTFVICHFIEHLPGDNHLCSLRC